MFSHLDEAIPVVVIYNYLETFLDYLQRAEDEDLIRERRCKGDRALLWLTARKLVFVMAPIPHAAHLRQYGEYSHTQYMVPAAPSPWLCLDILRETRLLTQLIEYAGPRRAVQLIPYATTPEFLQLAATLRDEHGIEVILPESLTAECLWLVDYIDSKSGFRALAAQCLPNSSQLLPEGIICRNISQAAEVAHWFGRRGKSCIVKPDRGGSGIGLTILRREGCLLEKDVLNRLQNNPFLRGDLILVEEFIEAFAHLSPSLELFVPPLGREEPQITYLSNQLFTANGFDGVLISKELMEMPWYPTLARNGMIIATQLQAMGYVGHFDIDTVVNDEGRIFLLEANARRTGGTHVHEFACLHFGANYLDEVVLLSHNKTSSGSITAFDELIEVIDDLLYPIRSKRRGVVIAHSSELPKHKWGYIIVSSTTADALEIQRELQQRLHATETPENGMF